MPSEVFEDPRIFKSKWTLIHTEQISPELTWHCWRDSYDLPIVETVFRGKTYYSYPGIYNAQS